MTIIGYYLLSFWVRLQAFYWDILWLLYVVILTTQYTMLVWFLGVLLYSSSWWRVIGMVTRPEQVQIRKMLVGTFGAGAELVYCLATNRDDGQTPFWGLSGKSCIIDLNIIQIDPNRGFSVATFDCQRVMENLPEPPCNWW